MNGDPVSNLKIAADQRRRQRRGIATREFGFKRKRQAQ
jgi:hypothetical protein